MKLFISDLHLGSPLFNMSLKLINLFKNPIVDEIYLVGDIFDSWEMDPLETYYRYESLITTINFINKPVFIIVGNHDPDKQIMQEVFFNRPVLDKIETIICGKKTLISHGHEACTDSKLARRLFFIHYYTQRILGINIKGVICDLWHRFLMLNSVNAQDVVMKIEKEICDTYKDKYDMIICGHTHIGKIVYNSNPIYINSGCVIYKPTYILADDCSFSLEEL